MSSRLGFSPSFCSYQALARSRSAAGNRAETGNPSNIAVAPFHGECREAKSSHSGQGPRPRLAPSGRAQEPPASDEEILAAALQFVRKVSGYRAPAKRNEAAFQAAVE